MTDIRIGLLLFPEMTQLDLTGPYEVFRAAPGAMTLLLAKTLDPVRAAGGLRILPDTVLAGCPQLDVRVRAGRAGGECGDAGAAGGDCGAGGGERFDGASRMMYAQRSCPMTALGRERIFQEG